MNFMAAAEERKGNGFHRHKGVPASAKWHAYRIVGSEVSDLSECQRFRWTMAPQDPWETLQSRKCQSCQERTGVQ